MIRLAPILIAILLGYLTWRFSAWQTAKTLDRQSEPFADPGLAPLLERMAEALGVRRIQVQLYRIRPVNGLAAPDGRIFLTQGFVDRYKSGDVSAEELATVIAHELGHVALGHSRRRMIDFSGQNAMRMALGMILSRFVPGLGMWLANMLTSLLAARLSRQDEYEADAYAAALLTKAGIGTSPQKSLFQKLESLTGGAGSPVPAWLMSHPHTADRIAAIEAMERRWSRVAG
ncbi:M48 family metalloprotease [Acidimangrovimonas sediminis]|uniref:M48 family metalloprotease n=1 Tax=Acidimangrovimonas sediminis TaxID=2056283 RepID=UPI000C7F8793|nr:M48 family metalloprotease [Acidimangrovimonas sediminis]